MEPDCTPEEVMTQLYQAFMSQHVLDEISDVSGSVCDTDNDDDDEDGDVYTSDGSEGEWHGDFGHLMGHIFHSFATGPSFDQGFKFSHSIPSQHQLVDVCEILRRQLASTLVNIKESNQGDTGGLLGDEYVAVSIVQKINELGHDTDKLSAVCKAAKRTGAGLAEQTELMQHRVHKLRSWIEKLQTYGRAAIAFKGQPGCGHPSCANAHLNPVPTTGKNADLPNEYEGQYPSSHMQTTVDPVKAADEAMQQLLLEEEAEKQQKCARIIKGTQKVNVAGSKKQSNMQRGKSKSREQSVCAGSSKPTASATEAVDDSEIPSEPESIDMVLGDDEVPEQWHIARSKKKGKDKARSRPSDPPQCDVARSAAGPSRLQHQEDAQNADSDAANLPQGGFLDDLKIQQAANKFMLLVEREGRWEHHWLVNALNPVTQQHNVTVRVAYKSLDKAVQQYIWRVLPTAQSAKQQQMSESAQAAHRLACVAPRHPSQSRSSPVSSRNLLSADLISTPVASFKKLLERHGVNSQGALTHALNPSSAIHVPAILAAHQTLNKTDSKLVWNMVPRQSTVQTSSVVRASSQSSPLSDAWKSAAPRATSCMGSRPNLGLRPGSRPRPVPGSRPIAATTRPIAVTSAPSQSAVIVEDPIPEELDPMSLSAVRNVRTWASSACRDGDSNDESKLCCVCMDQVRDAVMIPCNHAVTCVSCANLIQGSTAECPYCRKKIENVLCIP